MEAGLATHYVASDRLPQLEEALHDLGPAARDPEEVGRALQSFQVCGQLSFSGGNEARLSLGGAAELLALTQSTNRCGCSFK